MGKKQNSCLESCRYSCLDLRVRRGNIYNAYKNEDAQISWRSMCWNNEKANQKWRGNRSQKEFMKKWNYCTNRRIGRMKKDRKVVEGEQGKANQNPFLGKGDKRPRDWYLQYVVRFTLQNFKTKWTMYFWDSRFSGNCRQPPIRYKRRRLNVPQSPIGNASKRVGQD